MKPLNDALYNLSPNSGTNAAYAKGILVGCVATYMEVKQLNCDDAIKQMIKYGYFPRKIMRESVPDSWVVDLADLI